MSNQTDAQYLIDHGVDPATAQSFAKESAWLTQYSSPSAVPPTTVERMAPSIAPEPNISRPTPAPLAPAHEAKVAARAAEVQKLTGTDAATARSVAEQEFGFQRASGVERSVMLNNLAEGRTEQAIVDSVDAGMKPPSAPYMYTMPPAESEEDHATHTQFREAMFQAAIPVEVGSLIGREIFSTADELTGASDDEIAKYTGTQMEKLRRLWGDSTDGRLKVLGSWLREQRQRSADLDVLLTNRPELFSRWTVVEALSRVAESQNRQLRT